MFELMRQHPFGLLFSIIGHIALGGLLFVALEQQYGEELTAPGNDIEIVQAVLVNTPDVTEEIARLREQVTEPTVIEPEACLLYTSPSPRDGLLSRMPSSA